jgi:hypothetical protein
MITSPVLKRIGTFSPILALSLFASSGLSLANPVTCRTGPGYLNGTDYFDWTANYGAPFSTIPNGSTATSNSGLETATVNLASGNGQRRDEGFGGGWAGNFNPGDELLWTAGNGPLTLTFNQPLSGLGANIQADFYGGFTALLQVFNTGGGLIESFSEAGYSDGSNNGSAIFIGVANDPGIAAAEFSLTSATYNTGDFSINQLDIDPSQVPEPKSVLLFGSALAALAIFGRKRLEAK